MFLSRVPEFQRPGVEAVLRRYKQRGRSMSVSSSSEFDPMLYADNNRSPSRSGVNITQSKYTVGTLQARAFLSRLGVLVYHGGNWITLLLVKKRR